jgi:hypothetical protein
VLSTLFRRDVHVTLIADADPWTPTGKRGHSSMMARGGRRCDAAVTVP